MLIYFVSKDVYNIIKFKYKLINTVYTNSLFLNSEITVWQIANINKHSLLKLINVN